MDVSAFLNRVRSRRDYAGQLAHLRELPPRQGQFAQPQSPLPPRLQELLAAHGVARLYLHQAAALDTARAGQDLVVVTGTASGKTLCYHLPILEACLVDSEARALYLFPTKALAQDQHKGLLELLSRNEQIAEQIVPGVYDGDTPPAQRRRIQAEANLVLSNPDMLHASILPHHPKWARFFSELRFVVLDEVHTYRGILGANVACVLRRLMRVCRHYGAHPIFLAASATIANPGELTSQLIGRPVRVIDTDGSPRGRKYFALWNPSPLGDDRLARRSAADDAVMLMTMALEEDAQVLAFTRTRQAAELIHRYVHETLQQRNSPLAHQVRAYRGGYLPGERRQIEAELFQGKLRGVAATNALELGIDVGSLDVALLVQYPGTIASAWQQAGRSGRRHEESLAVLLGGNDPIDQFLLRNPDYFFAQSPEHAVVDPQNPYVLARHLKAAAFELPLDDQAVEQFGPLAEKVRSILCDSQELSKVGEKAYFTGGQSPALSISLRHMSDATFSIIEETGESPSGRRVIANVDAISAPELVYPEAVYLHRGESYLVRSLDLQGKVATVERCETDYYTQAVLESSVRITNERLSNEALTSAATSAATAFGDVDVSWKTVAFKKIKFNTRENIGFGPVDIPAQNLLTTAFWLTPGPEAARAMKLAGYRLSEGACGLRNLAVVALPMVAMCDPRDVSGVVDSQNLGRSTVIVYDRYPGGLGYAEKGFRQIRALLEICQQIVTQCECPEGCPSCVGLPNLRPAIHSDPDLTRGYPVPDKAATSLLLSLLLGAQPIAPQQQHAAAVELAS